MRTRMLAGVMAGLMFLLLVPSLGAAQNDEPYARLLADCLRENRVDYMCVKGHETDLAASLDSLAATDPDSLGREGQFAYFINAYNAWTLKLVADHYPVASIKDIAPFWSSPWKIDLVRLPGRTVTLDFLENDILRPRFKDPRVHFAINCASTSCPPLRAEPYRAGALDEQLDQAASGFINDGVSNYFKGDTLYLSKIFDWFEEDFGGREGVLAFVKYYAKGDLRRAFEAGAPREIRFLPYDWSLNAVRETGDEGKTARE